MFTMNKKRQEILTKAASVYRRSLIKSLEHRLEVARAKGDDKLIHQLEVEAEYLNIK